MTIALISRRYKELYPFTPPPESFGPSFEPEVSAVPSIMGVDRIRGQLDGWTTKVFVVIVMLSATMFLFSQLPGLWCPTWFGVILQGFTYGSALLFYISGDEKQR